MLTLFQLIKFKVVTLWLLARQSVSQYRANHVVYTL